jgi:hypothetical protein
VIKKIKKAKILECLYGYVDGWCYWNWLYRRGLGNCFMKAQLFRKWQKLNTIPMKFLPVYLNVKRCFIDKIVFRAGVTFRIYYFR